MNLNRGKKQSVILSEMRIEKDLITNDIYAE